MPQMTIFECQKDKNMTRVKNKVINVKVVLEFILSCQKWLISRKVIDDFSFHNQFWLLAAYLFGFNLSIQSNQP
jgi:hypothetical protein